MRAPRRLIRQRRRIFIGCEGESEQGYVALLTRLIAEAGLAVHLDAVLLQPGGGDPLAIVERAVARVNERENRRGDPYENQYVILDDDKWGQTPHRDGRIAKVAGDAGLQLIWQSPCHEALLLRHLDGCAQLRPPSTLIARKQLVAHWPGYQKAMPAVRLAERIDRAAVTRASAVEAGLSALLHEIGLV